MTLNQLTDYYAGLLAYLYRNQSNAVRQIQLYTKQVLGDYLSAQLETCFAVDTAVGAQLDIIGKYVGVARNIGDVIPSTQEYFGFELYQGGGNTHGFGDYTNSFTNAGFIFYLYQFSNGVPSLLTDEQYRIIIKLKIITNTSDGTLYSIQQAMASFLGGTVSVVDAQDMTLVYAIQDFPPISLTVLRQYLPRPMTLGLSVVVVSPIQRCLDDGTTLRKIDNNALRSLIAG